MWCSGHRFSYQKVERNIALQPRGGGCRSRREVPSAGAAAKAGSQPLCSGQGGLSTPSPARGPLGSGCGRCIHCEMVAYAIHRQGGSQLPLGLTGAAATAALTAAAGPHCPGADSRCGYVSQPFSHTPPASQVHTRPGCDSKSRSVSETLSEARHANAWSPPWGPGIRGPHIYTRSGCGVHVSSLLSAPEGSGGEEGKAEGRLLTNTSAGYQKTRAAQRSRVLGVGGGCAGPKSDGAYWGLREGPSHPLGGLNTLGSTRPAGRLPAGTIDAAHSAAAAADLFVC
jgi:hypothetical protein